MTIFANWATFNAFGAEIGHIPVRTTGSTATARHHKVFESDEPVGRSADLPVGPSEQFP
jgi:hypothetical protein